MVLFDTNTSQPIKKLTEEETGFVRFLSTDAVLYTDVNSVVHMMTLEGVPLHTLPGRHYIHSPLLINESFLVTGNKDKTLDIHDITTGKTLYKFYHPSSEGFDCFTYQQEHNRLIAVNRNGKVYILESHSN